MEERRAADFKASNEGVGVVEPHVTRLSLPPEGFALEPGGRLEALDVAWEACGRVSPDNDNVVFICHALTGDAHVAGIRPGESESSGWWDSMVGPGKAIDTRKWRVVCANVLGGCKGTTGPSSIDPATGKPYAASFPRFTIPDTVNVFRLLLKQIGVKHLAAVVGGSFGGIQAIEWAIAHPGDMDRLVVIASAASLNTQALAFDIVGRNAIVNDPGFNGGNYYGTPGPASGLANARRMAHITYLSQALLDRKFGRAKQESWLAKGPEFAKDRRDVYGTMFAIESYLQHQAEKFVDRFDANSYLGITYAMDSYDAAERWGSLDAACARIKARTLVVSLSGDWLFSAEQSKELVSSLLRAGARVSYAHLDVPVGHDGFLTHVKDLSAEVGSFLEPEEREPAAWQRRHHSAVAAMVPRGCKVIDVGCGSGALLGILRRQKNVTGCGVEVDASLMADAMKSGSDVVWEDVDDNLSIFPDDACDVGILSETLQIIEKPRVLLDNLLRVAKEAVVSFPNFACYNVRLQLLFRGRMPVGKQLPFAWYNTPNIHLFTLRDFRELCRRDGFEIKAVKAESRTLAGKLLLLFGMKNLGASRLIVKIARGKKRGPGGKPEER